MKKRLLLLVLFSVICGQVSAYSSDKFDITMIGAFQDDAKIYLNYKGTGDVKSAIFTVGDTKLILQDLKTKPYIFNIPKGYSLKTGKLGTKININGQEYVGPDRPLLQSIDILGVQGGNKANVTGVFSGSCNIIMSNGQSLGIDSKTKTVTLPTDVKGEITGGYIDCNGLKSNFLTFKLSIPQISYFISKDKKNILPGSTVLIKGKNLKKSTEDTYKIMFGNEQITGYTIVDDNTVQFDIPSKNLKNTQLKIIKNGFTSNIINVNSFSYPNISNVTYEKQDSNYVIKIMGKFDYTLGTVLAYYGSTSLVIYQTGSNYIMANFPKVTYSNSSSSNQSNYNNYTCSYYLKPEFMYVSIGGVNSNKFFTTMDLYPKIRYVSMPQCSSDHCEVEFIVDNFLKNNGYKVKLDGSAVSVLQGIQMSDNTYKIKISVSNTSLKSGKIEVETDKCLLSTPYYFDYSFDMSPKIFDISSSNGFKVGSNFQINGENFTDSLASNSSSLNINMSPDLVAKNSSKVSNYIKQSNNVKGSFDVNAKYKSGDKITVNLSNKFGNSNGGTIYMESSKISFVGNPYIDKVSFPDGSIFSGRKMIISGVGFSTTCSDNKILWGKGTYTPTTCKMKQLIFVIPNESTKSIQIKRGDIVSNTYTFGGEIGGSDYNEKSFDVIGSGFDIKKDIMKDTTIEIPFMIKNNISNIYIKNFSIIVEGIESLPISKVYIGVGSDENLYIYNSTNNRAVKTAEKILGYISKLGDKKYQIDFTNIYIPFDRNSIKINIKADIDQNYLDMSNANVYFPAQTIKYLNVPGSEEILQFKIDKESLGKITIEGKPMNCIDTDSGNKYCNAENGISTTTSSTGSQSTKPTVSTGSTVSTGNNILDPDAKYRKIADKLTDIKIKQVNKNISKIIDESFTKYPSNEYVQKMIKTYQKIIVTKDKVEYVKGLYEFLGGYKKFKKSI